MGLRVWLAELRAPFLLLTPDVVAFGTALAWVRGYFSPLLCAVTVLGALLLHMAVNVLNDYFDYVGGVDLHTKRTPFSGGSGILTAGLLNPKSVYSLGVASLLGGLAVGAYLALTVGPWVLALGLVGAATAYLYTPVLTKLGVGELSTGLNFGPLMVLGAYYVQTGRMDLEGFLAGIPLGLLIANLLLLNEFPDVEADARGGRRTLPILVGRPAAARIFAAVHILAFLSLAALVASGVLPVGALLGIVGAFPAFKASSGALRHSEEIEALVPFMAANVQATLITPLLATVGVVVQGLLA